MKSRFPDAATSRPEHRLLVALATAQVVGGQAEPLRGLGGGAMDWQLMLGAAREHRVTALCYPQLLALREFGVPGEILEAFRKQAISVAASNLRLATRLVEITQQAERAGVPLLAYKGVALAQMAYGNLGLREFVDLDFVIPQRDLAETARLLAGLGYQPENPALLGPGAPIPGEYVFFAVEADFHIEVHTEFTLRHFPSRLHLEPLVASREALSVAGQPFPTCSRADTLTLLAVHGSKDYWAELLWICDIAALIRPPSFDWDRAIDRARRMRCRRMVNVALFLASDLLDAPLPAVVKRGIETDKAARNQARWIAARLFAPRPVRSWEQARYRMRAVEGFWPGLGYAARLATTPAAEDWDAARLPGGLRFAYGLLRPLRLFWSTRRQARPSGQGGRFIRG